MASEDRSLPFSIGALADTVVAATDVAGIGLTIVLRRGDHIERVYSNRAFCDLLGRTPDEVARLSPLDLLTPRERARLIEMTGRFDAGEKTPSLIETEVVARDGSVIPVEVAMAWVAVDGGTATVNFIHDRRDRARMEAALRESELRFRALAEQSPESITVIADGKFAYANPAAAHSLGYEVDEFMALPIDSMQADPGERSVMVERLGRIFAGECLPPREYSGRHKDGSAVVIEISTTLILYGGRPALLSLGRDTSERRRWHAELARADRLATLGMLAAGVAHEINNPLTYTMLHLERLAGALPGLIADAAERPAIERMIAEALDGAGRVRAIVRDLLSVARHDHEAGPVPVGATIETAVRLAGAAIAERARVVRRGGDDVTVIGNAGRLAQVMLNLLLNAADAFDGGGEDHEIAIEVGHGDDGVVIAVIDNGRGIAPALLDRIFEPLFTTKPVGAGTGLGLAICRSIVTEMGGTLHATSTLGAGTRMELRLPPI